MLLLALLLLLIVIPVAGLLGGRLQKHMPGESKALGVAAALMVMLTIGFAAYMISTMGGLWQT